MLNIKNTIASLLAPKSTDVSYVYEDIFRIALLLRLDSYKFAHPFAYPKGIYGMSSYGEARISKDLTVEPFGIQMFAKRYLTQRITMADIDLAEQFAIAHFGRPLFARATWERIVREFNGQLPIIIRAVKEGTPITGGLPIYSVTAFDEDFHWLSSGVETMLQRAVWYPTTIATQDREIKKAIKQYYIDTGADLSLLPFALHDFGGRGVTCGEQAEIGGAAHLVNFMGSDTVEGILAVNHFYKEVMAAFSVYATEHSVECSFGLDEEGETEYLLHQIRQAPKGSIVSIVIDGKDTIRCATALCSSPIKEVIIESGVKVVFRPDSGDMIKNVMAILRLQEKAFGSTINAKGFTKINYVGIIQGDGVDHLSIKSLLGVLMAHGYAADNVIFGSGGALLQKCNRDTLKMAQKASAILVMDENGNLYWKGIAKDPVTDQGKKSKEGVLTLVRNKVTGEMRPFRLEQEVLTDDLEDIHQLVYYYGTLYNETTLAEVRERAAV